MKKIIPLLAMLMLLPFVTASVHDVGKDQMEINYADDFYYLSAVELPIGQNLTMEFRTYNYLPEPDFLWFKVTPFPDTSTPSPDTHLIYKCEAGIRQNITLMDADNWYDDGWYMYYTHFMPTSANQTYFTTESEQNYTWTSMTCWFEAENQNLMLQSYYAIGSEFGVGFEGPTQPICSLFEAPNSAIESIITKTSDAVNLYFEIFLQVGMIVVLALPILLLLLLYRAVVRAIKIPREED